MYQVFRLIFVLSFLALALLLEAQPYTEQYRMQYHFSPERNWINDPCGMVYLDGTYHLMYQYNPHGADWGNMSWGHATSTDLIHWQEHDVALYNDSQGAIFSGGAVVDYQNTAGFGDSAMVAIYTSAGTHQKQSLAYSLDRGKTWTKYNNNPVLPNKGIVDFRDPAVFWHEPSQQWVMTLAEHDQIGFYSSPDLKEWTYQSSFGQGVGAHGGVWECPDLFELTVEGTTDRFWVLMVSINPGSPSGGSATQYFIGDFDGHNFTLAPDFERWLSPRPSGDVVIFDDFENGYAKWTITGSAFGSRPAEGTLADQQQVSGYMGSHLVNSYLDGDHTVGDMFSEPFVVNHEYVSFMIGGGYHPGLTAIELIVGGEVVQSATGRNSEQLMWHNWDVSAYVGQSAYLRIVDEVTGEWGHINIDHICFTTAPIIQKEAFWVNHGPDDYAGRSFQQTPDGRVVYMSWMSNWSYAGSLPTTTWRGGMSLPRVLSLKSSDAGIVLAQRPVEEVYQLREDTLLVSGDAEAFQEVLANQYELQFSVNVETADKQTGVVLAKSGPYQTTITYDKTTKKVTLDREKSGLDFAGTYPSEFSVQIPQSSKQIDFQVFVDRSSLEVFINEGQSLITARAFMPSFGGDIGFTGNTASITQVALYQYASIWEKETVILDDMSHQKVRVYPNPFKETLHIDGLSNPAQLELFDLTGNRVSFRRIEEQGTTVLHIPGYTSSKVLILKIFVRQQVFTKKVIYK